MILAGSKIEPPPTKKEIVSALLERRRTQHIAESVTRQQRRDAAFAEVKAEASACLVDWKGSTIAEVDVGYDGMAVVDVHVVGRRLGELVAKYKAACVREPVFDEGVERAKIQEAVYGDRVKSILADKDTLKLLDAMLLKIGSVQIK